MKRLILLSASALLALGLGLLVGPGAYGFGPVVLTREGEQKIILIFGQARAP